MSEPLNLPKIEDTAPEGDFLSRLDSELAAAFEGKKVENPEPEPAKVEEPAVKADTPDPEPVKVEKPEGDKVVSPKAKDFTLIKTQRDEAKKEAEQARQEAETARRELEDLRKQLEEVKATTSDYSKVKETAEALTKEVSAVRVEASPEYQEVVNKPLNNIREASLRLANKYRIKPEDIVDAFAETDEATQTDKVSELVSNMNEPDRLRFYSMVDDFNVIMAKRQEILSQAEVAWNEIQAKREQETKAQVAKRKEDWSKATDKLTDALVKNIPFLAEFQELPQIKKAALEKNADELPVEEAAYSVLSGLILKPLAIAFHAERKKVADLEKTLAAYKAATPGAGGGGEGSRPDPKDDENIGFLEALERAGLN